MLDDPDVGAGDDPASLQAARSSNPKADNVTFGMSSST
jgi:hypothetical protein